MLLRVELIDYTASASHGVQFELYSKNAEDTGNGTQVIAASPSISTVSFSAPGGTPSQADLIKTIYIESGTTSGTGLGEMIRIKATAGGGIDGEWLELRIHPPIFINRSKG
jgi:hypothetical protein